MFMRTLAFFFSLCDHLDREFHISHKRSVPISLKMLKIRFNFSHYVLYMYIIFNTFWGNFNQSKQIIHRICVRMSWQFYLYIQYHI